MRLNSGWKPSQTSINITKEFLTERAQKMGLSYDELLDCTPKEREELMRQRGTLKKTGILKKTKNLLAKAYTSFGEKLGLIEYNEQRFYDCKFKIKK